MLLTVPNYYNRFQCIADKCPDTCCAGWSIVIDKKSKKKYKKYKGDFAGRMHNSINWLEGTFKQYEKRCAFLNDENLCDLYAEVGPDYLCKTCKRYPRHIEEFEDVREISLSLSCPEVAKIILSNEKKVKYLSKEKECEVEEYDDFDYFLFTKLMDVRDFAIDILQKRDLSIYERMGIVLGFVHDMQSRIDNGELFEIDNLLKKYQKDTSLEKLCKKLAGYSSREIERFEIMNEAMGCLDALEVLDDNWTDMINQYRKILYNNGYESYNKYQKEFSEYYKGKEYEYEQLAVYFVFTYFCGAVYDEDAYSKMKLALMSTMILRELDVAIWVNNEGKFSIEDQINICYKYSREVEHSDENLNLLEEIMCKEPVFKLEKMLIALMSV